MKIFTPKTIKIFDIIVSWLFAVVLLQAAYPHWGNPYYFLGSVYAYKMVDPGLGQMAAMTFPVVQLGLAFCLLTRTFINGAHLLTFGLFACFATVQTTSFLRGLDISCGCFGPGHETTIGGFTLSIIYSLLILSMIRNWMLLFPRNHSDVKIVSSQLVTDETVTNTL